MKKNKTNKIIGILSIAWGVILLLYQILRNTVMSDWYFDIYMKKLLTYGDKNAEQFKLAFEAFNNILIIAFLVSLIVIVILAIIYNKKRNIKIFSKEASSNGTVYMILGLILYVILGWNLISLFLVLIGGIYFMKN